MDSLVTFINEHYPKEAEAILAYLPKQKIDPQKIKAIMISEVAADHPMEDFYSQEDKPEYLQTTLAIFELAGAKVKNIEDILDLGIYLTNAVKLPKTTSTIPNETIEHFLPILEAELALFPNLEVVMLMGDVARKAFNKVAKAATKKNALPSGSTYKMRHSEWYYQGMRILPAYILTGKNLKIEKSKSTMSAEEIQKMLAIIYP